MYSISLLEKESLRMVNLKKTKCCMQLLLFMCAGFFIFSTLHYKFKNDATNYQNIVPLKSTDLKKQGQLFVEQEVQSTLGQSNSKFNPAKEKSSERTFNDQRSSHKIEKPKKKMRRHRSISTMKNEEIRKLMEMRYYPWPKISSCKNISNSFAPAHSHKLVAVASYPCSGNTWLRSLIESATGLFTGCVYIDEHIYNGGLYGEIAPYDSGMTIAVKTHAYLGKKDRFRGPIKDNKIYERGVVIIRNPFESIISYRNFLGARSHTAHTKKSDFIGEGWSRFVLAQIRYWKDFSVKWLTSTNEEDICIIFYEELKLEPLKIVEEVVEFLNASVDSQRMRCILEEIDGKFKRPPRELNNPFTTHLKNNVYEAIDVVNDILLRKANKTLPLQHYKFYNETEAAMARKGRLSKQN